jgi:hypothetical protein
LLRDQALHLGGDVDHLLTRFGVDREDLHGRGNSLERCALSLMLEKYHGM